MKFVLLLFVLFSSSSCQIVYRTLLGVDASPKWQSQSKTERITKKRNIPDDQAFVLDTASYVPYKTNLFLEAIKQFKEKREWNHEDSLLVKALKKKLNDDLQPVQVRYFKSTGEAFFKMINCYLDPPIPMRWNVRHTLDVFPPQALPELKVDDQDDLQNVLPFIKSLHGKSITMNDLPKSEYYAVVFWNSYMIRPSKRLISQINKYNQSKGNGATYILFVNNHNSEMWRLMDAQSKENVMKSTEIIPTN